MKRKAATASADVGHAKEVAVRRRRAQQETTSRSSNEPGGKYLPATILDVWNDEALQAIWDNELGSSIKTAFHPKVELRQSPSLSSSDLEACLSIVRYTSREDYKASSIGWRESLKRKEMLDPAMMYIILRAEPNCEHAFAPELKTCILGFASFMLTNDDPPYEERTVIYIYEVHVGETYRGQGLGRFLVYAIEAMADMADVGKTMLTVFTSNVGAISAYSKMGYEKDQCSPPDRIVRGRVIKADYIIMGKQFNKIANEE